MNSREDEQESPQIQIQKFIQALKQEILSPTVLPFQAALFLALRQAVKEQEMRIKEFMQPDDDSSSNHEKSFKLLLYKSETEKLNYLLKEYLRVRIRKIEKFAFYFIKNQTLAEKLLSESELHFMKQYAELKYKYLDENVLKNLVKTYQGLAGLEVFFSRPSENKLILDTKQSKVDLVEPNQDAFVFAKIQTNPELVRLNYDIVARNVEGQPVMQVGSTLYAPHRSIARLLEDESARLI